MILRIIYTVIIVVDWHCGATMTIGGKWTRGNQFFGCWTGGTSSISTEVERDQVDGRWLMDRGDDRIYSRVFIFRWITPWMEQDIPYSIPLTPQFFYSSWVPPFNSSDFGCCIYIRLVIIYTESHFMYAFIYTLNTVNWCAGNTTRYNFQRSELWVKWRHIRGDHSIKLCSWFIWDFTRIIHRLSHGYYPLPGYFSRCTTEREATYRKVSSKLNFCMKQLSEEE